MIPDLDDCYVTGDQQVYEGQNISLKCNGTGYPIPTFAWYLGGRQLKINPRININENQLNILNATAMDEGEYACVAINRAGQVSYEVDVDVEGGWVAFMIVLSF